jgi:hypothetical protein
MQLLCADLGSICTCDHGLALKLEDGAVNGQGLGGREAELLRRTQRHLVHHHSDHTQKHPLLIITWQYQVLIIPATTQATELLSATARDSFFSTVFRSSGNQWSC